MQELQPAKPAQLIGPQCCGELGGHVAVGERFVGESGE